MARLSWQSTTLSRPSADFYAIRGVGLSGPGYGYTTWTNRTVAKAILDRKEVFGPACPLVNMDFTANLLGLGSFWEMINR